MNIKLYFLPFVRKIRCSDFTGDAGFDDAVCTFSFRLNALMSVMYVLGTKVTDRKSVV